MTAPSIALTGWTSGITAVLSWAATDPEIVNWRIYMQDDELDVVDIPWFTFNLDDGAYDFCVTGINAAGDECGRSNVVTIQVGRPLLTPPADVKATGRPGSINITWTQNAEANLTGYSLYSRPNPDVPFTLLDADLLLCAYVDLLPEATVRYYYVIAHGTGVADSTPSAVTGATAV